MKIAYVSNARIVDRLFKAILPDSSASEFGAVRALLNYLSGKILALNPTVDVTAVMDEIENLLIALFAAKACTLFRLPTEERI